MAHHILALLFISIEICIMVCREIWSGKAASADSPQMLPLMRMIHRPQNPTAKSSFLSPTHLKAHGKISL